MCYYKWEAWYNLSNSGLKTFCARLYHVPNILLRGTKYRAKENDGVAMLYKGTNWKFIFLWRVINWHVLQIAKAHFRCSIWFMISLKSITRCSFLCRGALVHQISARHTKKLCTGISNSFSPSCGLVFFY